MKASLALVLMLTAALYARHVATAGWVYEDSNAVMANGAVTGAQPIQIDRARWLSSLSHRLVWTAAGNHPAAHHAVNLALHLGNGVLVSAVAGVFLPPVAAWGAATLFLVHPVQTEAVAYVASRSELLATTFALLAGLIALHADRGWHYVAVVGAVALAVCAKESAAVIVPILAVSDLFRGRRLSAWRYGACLVPVGLIAVSVLAQDYTARSELGVISNPWSTLKPIGTTTRPR